MAEATKPETLAALNAAVAAVEPDPADCLVFPMAMVDRIGHLGVEPHYLDSMFGERYRRIIIVHGPVTGPRALPGVNRALWEMLSTRFAMVETEHPLLPRLGILNQGIAATGTYDLYLAGPNRFYRDYSAHRVAGGALKHYDLSDDLAERGRGLLRSLGIEPDARLVLLHARERSYVPDPAKRAHGDLRAVDIASFRPAVDRLAAEGYVIMRIGDPSGPTFAHASDRVVDLAHLADYAPWMDVWLAGSCAFAVTTQSGPEALVRGFGRPQLATNLLPTVYSHHLPTDRFLFKPVHLRDRPDPLSYPEILAAALPNRLVAGPLPDAAFYRREGYRFADIDPETLADAATEMAALVRAPTSQTADGSGRRFLDLGAGYQRSLEGNARAKATYADLYTYAFDCFGRVSTAAPAGLLGSA